MYLDRNRGTMYACEGGLTMAGRNRTDNRDGLILHRWVRFEDMVKELDPKYSFRDGGKFLLDNWDCKYLDMRLDVRTGAVYIKPGNGR